MQPGCNDAKVVPANLLHAWAYYSEYNELLIEIAAKDFETCQFKD